MTRAKNSRGHNSMMSEVIGQRTCGQRTKIVTELLKMKKTETHGGTTVAVTLREIAHVLVINLHVAGRKNRT